jgi:hypothetical protein
MCRGIQPLKVCRACSDMSLVKYPVRRRTGYFTKLASFTIKSYEFTNKPEHACIPTLPFERSGFDNLQKWSATFGLDADTLIQDQVCNLWFGGIFQVTREQVLRTSHHTYAALRNEQHYQNEEVDHFIERLWGPLMCAGIPRMSLLTTALVGCHPCMAIFDGVSQFFGMGDR